MAYAVKLSQIINVHHPIKWIDLWKLQTFNSYIAFNYEMFELGLTILQKRIQFGTTQNSLKY